jgi:hypothetical protein
VRRVVDATNFPWTNSHGDRAIAEQLRRDQVTGPRVANAQATVSKINALATDVRLPSLPETLLLLW